MKAISVVEHLNPSFGRKQPGCGPWTRGEPSINENQSGDDEDGAVTKADEGDSGTSGDDSTGGNLGFWLATSP